MDTSSQTLQLFKKIQNYLFDLNAKIGEGSFSRVYRGNNLHNNAQVAVKKVRVSDIKSKIARRLLDWQVNILKEVDHPNIIKCLDIHFSANNCYMITELCQGGNVYQLLKKSPQLPIHTVNQIILSVFQALSYLVQKGIVHRDIKASNIFISNGLYKVGDFGFAIKAKSLFKDVSIGSFLYMSPEGLIHNLYGPKTDVWAFGILIYELLHGKTPMEHCASEEQLKRTVLQPPSMKADIPSDLKLLMLSCLRVNEKERMTINDIGESNFIKRVKQEIELERSYEKELSLISSSTANSSSSIPSLSSTTLSHHSILS